MSGVATDGSTDWDISRSSRGAAVNSRDNGKTETGTGLQ